MNYKESAAKLNEFNDFMDCIKLQLALKQIGREANKLSFKLFIYYLSKLINPLSFEVGGFSFKDTKESDWVLPKGEIVFNSRLSTDKFKNFEPKGSIKSTPEIDRLVNELRNKTI